MAGAALTAGLVAAARPVALAKTEPGLWEVRQVPNGNPVRLCVRDIALLAQYEHRSGSCTRVVIKDQPPIALIHYTCSGGGFGQSHVTAVTPRSLRIETQGISGNYPFNYLLHARRVGDC